MFKRKYKFSNKEEWSKGVYKLVTIRYQDRFDIMKWRNEQIFHLRQNKVLTEEDQEHYFSNVVSKLFDQIQPNQLLFSYLENEKCIGYGGLVHINWVDKNAEISFILNTEIEADLLEIHWKTFLSLLEKLAFEELGLYKIYTYAFDLRPYLYPIFEDIGFKHEATLKNHCFYNDKYINIIIHSKFNNYGTN